MEGKSSQIPCIIIEDDDDVDDDIILVEDKNEKSSPKTESSRMPLPKKSNFDSEIELLKTLISSGENVPVKYKTFFEMAKRWKPKMDHTIILAAWKRILKVQTKHMLTEGTLFSTPIPEYTVSAPIPEDTDSQDTISTIVLDTDSISESEDTGTGMKITIPAINNSCQNISSHLDNETDKEVKVEDRNVHRLELIHATYPEDKALHELNSKAYKKRLTSKNSVESQAVLAGSKKKMVQLNQKEKKRKSYGNDAKKKKNIDANDAKRKRKSCSNDAKRKRKSCSNDAKRKRKSCTNNDDYFEHKKLYLSSVEYKNFMVKQKKLIYAEKKKLAHKQVAKVHDRMVDLIIPKYFNRNLIFD